MGAERESVGVGYRVVVLQVHSSSATLFTEDQKFSG